LETTASAKYVRLSASKARRVADLIRGHHVEEARRILRFSSLGASKTVAKVLNSAVANAEATGGTPAELLVVKRAYVDEGPTLKRFRPRAQGRATRIRKRTSHITIVVDQVEEAVRPQGGR
jgi:large subunit ribosomal protein L22